MEAQREWLDKDYYKVLGVDKTASAKELSKSYRTLARKYHPDTNNGDEVAEERFKEISAAYEVVGDEETRKKYDEFRSLGGGMGGMGGMGGPGFGGGGFRPTDTQDLGDLSDILGGLFGAARGGRSGFGGFGAMPGMDLQTALDLSFEEAIHGVTKTVRLTSEALPKPVEVNVRIPSGVKDGQRIRVPGKGAPSSEGGEAGDLLVSIKIARHKQFEREGNHLLVDVPITYAEAVLGADVKVPTLNGSAVTVRIPAGTQSGKVLRVRGRGVKTGAQTGDLLAKVTIFVPGSPNDEEVALAEKLLSIQTQAPREK